MKTFFKPTAFKIIFTLILLLIVFGSPLLQSFTLPFSPNTPPQPNLSIRILFSIRAILFYPLHFILPSTLSAFSIALSIIFILLETYLISCCLSFLLQLNFLQLIAKIKSYFTFHRSSLIIAVSAIISWSIIQFFIVLPFPWIYVKVIVSILIGWTVGYASGASIYGIKKEEEFEKLLRELKKLQEQLSKELNKEIERLSKINDKRI